MVFDKIKRINLSYHNPVDLNKLIYLKVPIFHEISFWSEKIRNFWKFFQRLNHTLKYVMIRFLI